MEMNEVGRPFQCSRVKSDYMLKSSKQEVHYPHHATDPFFGNVEDLYESQISSSDDEHVGTEEYLAVKTDTLPAKPTVNESDIGLDSLMTLRTPLTRVLKDKVKCIHSYDVV